MSARATDTYSNCDTDSYAAQRIGVQRPATALTESDPAAEVCRQTATKVNWTELLLVRLQRHVGQRVSRAVIE